MLMKSLERLEETIEAETSALQRHDMTNQQDFNRRKSQSLLEISRLVRALEGRPFDRATAERLEQLKAKLEANQVLLEMHLRAVQEVADIISGAIQSADSDGTYSADLFR